MHELCSRRSPTTDRKKNDAEPKWLSGGNPQIPKGEELDEDRLRSWIEQASRLPGENM